MSMSSHPLDQLLFIGILCLGLVALVLVLSWVVERLIRESALFQRAQQRRELANRERWLANMRASLLASAPLVSGSAPAATPAPTPVPLSLALSHPSGFVTGQTK